MARKKKDGRFINYYIDRTIFDRLERYADDKSLQMTSALERILDEHLTRYEAEISKTERYCPNCHLLVRDIRCPKCGQKWLEQAKPEDYCLVTEKDTVWAGVLEDTFRRNEIPFLKQSAMGAGLTAKAGSLLDTIRFYVRYSHYHQAVALCELLFSQQAEIISEEDSL